MNIYILFVCLRKYIEHMLFIKDSPTLGELTYLNDMYCLTYFITMLSDIHIYNIVIKCFKIHIPPIVIGSEGELLSVFYSSGVSRDCLPVLSFDS